MINITPGFAIVVAEILSWLGGAAVILFTVHAVLTFGQSSVEKIWARPGALAEAAERFVPAVVALCICVSARSLGEEAGRIAAGGARDGEAVLAAWRALGVFVIQGVLLSMGSVIALGIAGGGLSAQIAHLVGQPHALTTSWERVIGVALTAGLTFLSVEIARLIVLAAA